jgi:hypothetical protein
VLLFLPSSLFLLPLIITPLLFLAEADDLGEENITIITSLLLLAEADDLESEEHNT